MLVRRGRMFIRISEASAVDVFRSGLLFDSAVSQLFFHEFKDNKILLCLYFDTATKSVWDVEELAI